MTLWTDPEENKNASREPEPEFDASYLLCLIGASAYHTHPGISFAPPPLPIFDNQETDQNAKATPASIPPRPAKIVYPKITIDEIGEGDIVHISQAVGSPYFYGTYQIKRAKSLPKNRLQIKAVQVSFRARDGQWNANSNVRKIVLDGNSAIQLRERGGVDQGSVE